ncbi:MAG: DUF2341 domain-containing protein [Gammaproteobacteria bacterium]
MGLDRSTLTDYQIQITIDSASLVSAGKMNSDGSDIRFRDSNGATELNYWIESGINTASTKIWVKVTSIPNPSKTIYFYYGNPGATSQSDADATMIFHDDFESYAESYNLDGSPKWTNNNPTYNLFQAKNKNGSKRLYYKATTSVSSSAASLNWGNSSPIVIEYEHTTDSTVSGENEYVRLAGKPIMPYNSSWQSKYTGSWVSLQGVATNTTYAFKVIHDGTNAKIYINGVLRQTAALTSYATNITMNSYLNRVEEMWLDNIKAYQYASPTPSPSVGSEEVNSGTLYPDDNPTVVNNAGQNYTTLISFSEALGIGNAGAILYQISNDGINWYYYNGSNWVSAIGFSESNTAVDVNTNLSSFVADVGLGTFYFKAFLNSDGLQKVELDQVDLNYVVDTITPTWAINAGAISAQPENSTSVTINLGAGVRSDDVGVYRVRVYYVQSASCDSDNVDRGTASFQDFTTNPATINPVIVTGLTSGQAYCFEATISDSAGNEEIINSTSEVAASTPVPRPGSIVWRSPTSVEVNNASLTKTGANGWDADASSVAALQGDGYCEFTATETNLARFIGLNYVDDNTSYTDIDYAIYANQLGAVWVYENGVKEPIFSGDTYSSGDKLRAERVGTTVYYKKNGTTIYTSTVTATVSPMYCEAALYHTNASLTNATIIDTSGVSYPELDDSSGSNFHLGAGASAIFSAASAKFGSSGLVSNATTLSMLGHADETSLDLSTNVTWEAWFKVNTNTGVTSIIQKREVTGGLVGGYILRTNGTNVECYRYSGGWVAATAPFSIGVRYHAACVYDGINIKLWLTQDGGVVNATPSATTAATGAINANTSGLLIGGWDYLSGSAYFDGEIDEVRISNSVRSYTDFCFSAECASDANTVALYHFNKTTGSSGPLKGAIMVVD